MRFYTIHAPRRQRGTVGASLDAAIAGARAVKDGFSWPAFFFSVLWALWHRLWLVALAMFVIELAVGMVADLFGLNLLAEMVLSLGVALIIGWVANDLLRDAFERRGLADLGVVMAPSAEDAIERYFVETAPHESAMPNTGRRAW